MENEKRNDTPNEEGRNKRNQGDQSHSTDPDKKENSQSKQDRDKEKDIPDYSNLDIDESTGGSAMGDPEDGEPYSKT